MFIVIPGFKIDRWLMPQGKSDHQSAMNPRLNIFKMIFQKQWEVNSYNSTLIQHMFKTKILKDNVLDGVWHLRLYNLSIVLLLFVHILMFTLIQHPMFTESQVRWSFHRQKLLSSLTLVCAYNSCWHEVGVFNAEKKW